jgi:hypothetical protein
MRRKNESTETILNASGYWMEIILIFHSQFEIWPAWNLVQ